MYRASGINRVAVLGAGTMGHGIAQLAAMAGYEVMLLSVKPSSLQRALERIRWSLEKFAERGTIAPEDIEGIVARIRTTLSMEEAVKNSDFVIEAVPENLELKRATFRKADLLAPPHTILASNTSTLPITELAEATQRPDKVVGTHFFNPPQLMPLVEVVKGRETSEETLQKAAEFARSLRKEVVICRRDVPGFIVNRILLPILDEAAWTVRRGEARVMEVDSAFRYKLGLRIGPFELMDYAGIDVVYQAMVEVRKRDPTLIAFCPLIEEMYRRGWWGRKSGRGFYAYPTEARRAPEIPREAGKDLDLLPILAPAMNSAARLLRDEVTDREGLEKAVKLGLGFPKGILELAESFGLSRVIEVLREKTKRYGEHYTPDDLLVKMSGIKGVGEESEKRKELFLSKEPPIAWVILNRPEKLNALTPGMVEELERVFEALQGDEEVKVVVLRGAGGRAFSAGADIEFLHKLGAEEAGRVSRRWQEVFEIIEKFPKPVVAAIEGYCLGAGLELALVCDLRLAREDAVFGHPEIELGLIPGAGGTQRLARLLGLSRAKELIMLGERIGTAEALRTGLVNKVYSTEKFEEEVKSLVKRLAEKPSTALNFAKQAINLALTTRLEDGLKFETNAFSKLISTRNARERISEFLSKRRPEGEERENAA